MQVMNDHRSTTVDRVGTNFLIAQAWTLKNVQEVSNIG